MNKDIKKPDHQQPQNLKMTTRFLHILSQGEDTSFTFQTFTDKNSSNLTFPKILHGTLEQHMQELMTLQENGAGVFVTVNETDGKGRKVENITKVRAVFVDLDGSPLGPILSAPLDAHVLVESSPGRYHAYWLIEGIELKDFSFLQKELIARFHSDPQVHDLSRVMRLPGFLHQKKESFLTHILQESGGPPFSLATFLNAFSIDLTRPSSSSNLANPILEALEKHNLIIKKQSLPLGCWTIRCPWEHLHSQEDHGTKYYEPYTNGYKEHGFQCFHQHCQGRTIRDLRSFLGLVQEVEDLAPLPLYRQVALAKKYPFEALGEVLGPAAMAIHEIVKAPDAICAQSVLAAAALVVQPFYTILIDGREIPLSEFFITIGESGDRKSATDKIALKAVYDKQRELAKNHRMELHTYKISLEAQDIRRKTLYQTDKIFEELPIQPPLRPLLVVDEPTYEGLVTYLAIGQPSIGLFSDEGGRFFGGFAMNSDNVLKTIAGLSSLWDGKEINRMRAGDGNMILYGRRFSLHLMIQEMLLKKLMGHSLVEVQGFLPRCLIAFPETMAGNRSYSAEDIFQHKEIISYSTVLADLLNRKHPVEPLPAPQNELHPPPLTLTKDAKAIWIRYHDEMDKKIAPKKEFYPIRRLGSKAAEHALRLAAILTVIENSNAKEIPSYNIENGIKLMDYYLEERLRIQNCLSIDDDLSSALELLEWFWEKNKKEISLPECYQRGPASIRSAERSRKIFGILQKHGWVVPIPNGVVYEGKQCKEAWIIKSNPEGC